MPLSQLFAASGEDCGRIENARERLACFDQLYLAGSGAKELPKIKVETIRAPEGVSLPPQQTSPKANTSSAPVLQAPTPTTRDENDPLPSRGMFDPAVKLDMDAEIAGLRRADGQRMVFRLDNGQIWMQSSPRDLPFSKGEKINIKNGRIGGFIMRNEGGTSTRVKRIE